MDRVRNGLLGPRNVERAGVAHSGKGPPAAASVPLYALTNDASVAIVVPGATRALYS
jgi:hypothetical protein